MKKIKKFKTLFALIGFTILTITGEAQIYNATVCSSATPFTLAVNSQTVDQGSADGWLSFTATSTNENINLKNIFPGSTTGKITNAKAYSGSCGSLTQIASDTISIANDTLLTLNLNGLTVGNTYYIYSQKDTFPGQCYNYVCSDNALFEIVIPGCFCGFHWGLNPVTPDPNVTPGPNPHDFDGFQYGCLKNTCTGDPVPPDLAVCQATLCSNKVYFGYSENSYGFGDNVVMNYTLYVFPSSGATYSVPVTFTTMLTFTPSLTYTIMLNAWCSPQPDITPTLTPAYFASQNCSCGGQTTSSMVLNIQPPPDCNVSIPNPICANQPFCIGNNNQIPPYNVNWTISGNPGVILPSGCVPGGLPAGPYSVSFQAWLYKPNSSSVDNSYCWCGQGTTFSIGPVPDPISITTTSTEICVGNGAQLYANPPLGANDYTWNPGGIIVNPITVTPTTSTIYTVLSQSGACVAQGTVLITTFTVAPYFTATLSPEFVCPASNSTTLTLSPIGPYTLQTSVSPSLTTAFITTIALTPTATGNYTIFGYDPNGCLTNSVVKVNVVPCACLTVSGTAISGNIVPGLFQSNSTLKAVSDVTLNFPPPSPPTNDPFYGFDGNEIIVYPGVKITVAAAPGGTVYLRGVYAHGCGEMWEGFVMPFTYTRFRIAPAVTGTVTTLIEDAKVAINMLNTGPAVPPNFVTIQNIFLEVESVTFNKNITGIRISNYQKDENNYPFKIINSLFTSRSVSITPNPAPTPTYNVPSWPNTTTIKNSVNGGGNVMQTPHIDNTTYSPTAISSPLYNYFGYPSIGLELNTVGLTTLTPNYQFNGIEIGSGNADFNCFDNLRNDIYAYNSNLTVVNTVFQNGQRDGKASTFGGKGIVAVSDYNATDINRNSVKIISAGSSGICRFYEKTVAADISDYFNVEIKQAEVYSFLNNYNQFFSSNTFGNAGFNINTNRYQVIALQNNKLYNIKNAMLIGLTNIALGGPFNYREVGQINVETNLVNRYIGVVPPGGAPYINIGLSIADPVTVANNTVLNNPLSTAVTNNTFTGVNNGINVLNLSFTPLGIVGNTVSMLNETPIYSVSPTQKGIFAGQSLKHTFISSNAVSGPNVWGDSLKGIMTVFNQSLSVRCNTTANVARGIEFNGMQTTDFFEDNHMNASNNIAPAYGLVLANSAVLSSTSTTIGSNTRPTNNEWNGTWSLPNFKTGTFNSSAQQSKLYIQYFVPNLDPDGSGTTDGPAVFAYFHLLPPFDANNTLLGVILPALPGCRIGGGGIPGGGGNMAASSLLEQAVTNSIPYNILVSETQHINKSNAYRGLKANPSIMIGSPILTAFYNTAQTSYLQAHTSIEENLVNNNISAAQSLITALTPANAIETNYKNFYQVFKNTKNNAYTGVDSTNLANLANMCPYSDGAVVFQARALYNILYRGFYRFYDNCNNANVGGRSGSAITPKEKDQAEINVVLKTTLFPNPNDGQYVLRINKVIEKEKVEISIFDITGKMIMQESKFLQNENEVKLSNNLYNGTYIVKVKLEDGTIDVHRLIINK